jgi:hypothetical protein
MVLKASAMVLIEVGWMALVLASLLGWTVGSLACSREPPGRAAVWLNGLAAAVVLCGAAAAALRGAPGRVGLDLDLALLMGAAYLGGCWLGFALRWIAWRATRRGDGLAPQGG